MPYSAVIFDVDGVLVDSPHEFAWRQTLDELMQTSWADIKRSTTYAPDRFDTSLYQTRVAGKPRQTGALAVLEYFHVPDPAARAVEYAREKQKKLVDLIERGQFHVFPDAQRFVLDCVEAAIPIAAASSSKNARQLLASIPIDGPPSSSTKTLLDLFSADVSGRDVAHGKPAPDIFLEAARELHVCPDHCVVIEDAVSGVAAAKSGGMFAIGVARLQDDAELAAAHADLVVQSLDEVNRNAFGRGMIEFTPQSSNT